MKSSFSKVLLVFMACGVFAPVFSHAGEEKAKEGEEPAEGKAKKGSTTLTVSESSELEANISAIQAKIKAKEEELHALIAEKSKLDDKNPRVNEVVKSMATSYHELRGLQEDLEKQKSILRFRFPEHASEVHKESEKGKSKEHPETLERYEKEVKTDQKLDQTLQTVEKVYGVEKEKKTEEKSKNDDPESTTPLIQK